MHIGTCLLCLAVDRRTLDVARSQLLPVYEKITDFKIKSDSHHLCFICHTRLRHAHQLWQLAKRTQHLIVNFNTNKFEKSIETHKSLVELSRCRVSVVDVAPVPSASARVKDEPAEDVDARGDGGGSVRPAATDAGCVAPRTPAAPVSAATQANKPDTRAARKRRRRDDILASGNVISTLVSSESRVPAVCAVPVDPQANGQNALTAEDVVSAASEGNPASSSEVEREGGEQCVKDSTRGGESVSSLVSAGAVSTGDVSKAKKAEDAEYVATDASKAAGGATVDGDQTFPCRVCPFRSARRETLRRHERGHAGPRRYCCAHCGRHFPHKGNYVRHLRTHTGDRPYACALCPAAFAQLSTLNAHLLVHTGDRPFECSQCGARFGRRGVLRRHEATHAGLKPYRCAECGSRFARKSCLVDHERTHVGVKPYACDACPRSFFRKTDLNQHRRTHTGAKPYACDRCERRFAHKTSLVNHRRTHTGDRPYRCTICRRTFNQRSNLLRHERRHEP